jgi:nucleoside-diphosphate-sugar epimerase
MANILVLGGTQFFGKRLVERLLHDGDKVTIATRGKTPDPFEDRVERLIIDREDRDSLEAAFKEKSWDIVYDQSCFSPLEAKNAAEALKGKVLRYIFTSSMAVYDFGENNSEENFDPYTFDYVFKTRREYPGYAGYQEAKRASEAFLFQNTELEVVAVRFPIVIGEDDYTNRLKFHVDRILNQEPIGILHPNARYSFILSDEAAWFLDKIGRSSFTGPINPGSRGDISLEELAAKIGTVTGVKAKIEPLLTKENASPYGMDGSWSINTNKAQLLGYEFSNLEESIDTLIRFYSKEKSSVI